jgi:hypothetical protein
VCRGAQGATWVGSGSRSMEVGYVDCSAKNDEPDAENSEEDFPRSIRVRSGTEHEYRKYSLT